MTPQEQDISHLAATQQSEIATQRWDEKAANWDERIGADGNQFHRVLIAPTVTELLAMQSGEKLLDIACGNGQFSRQMAADGVEVMAVDASEVFLERARHHTENAGADIAARITYRHVDATDEASLLACGEAGSFDAGSFDAVVCNNALMDLATIRPLYRAVYALLRSGGRFVFAVSHPCFNGASARRIAYEENHAGKLEMIHAVQVSRYLEDEVGLGTGMKGETLAHYYFDRPINSLLRDGFEAGLVVDGFEEPMYEAPNPTADHLLGWSHYRNLPPSLIVRMRKV